MSVCPGCGRCRECGHAAPPIRTYPWYGPYPVTPPTWPQPIWWHNASPTVPQPPYKITSGTNWTAV